MSNLVLIEAPNDYVHKGKRAWVNPDYICSVSRDGSETLVKLWNGEGYVSSKTVDEVVADINRALNPVPRECRDITVA